MNSTPNPKLRLLFIAADRFPPFRSDVSVLFAKEIATRGHQIDWILQSERPLRHAYRTQWSGGTVFVGPMVTGTSMISTIKRHLFGVFHDTRMFHAIRQSQYDFIVVKDKFISALMAIATARIHQVKLIYWLSYPFPEDSLFQVESRTARYPLVYWIRGHLFRFLLYKILMPLSYHTFVQTEQMKQNASEMGIPKEKMTAVPMAVSITDIPFFGHKTFVASDEGERRVVYLGTLAKVRKMDFLLRSFKQVLRKKKNVRLYLVGGSENPSDEQLLRREAESLGIQDSVTLTGFLPRDEAYQYVKEADVCVSTIRPSPILDCGSPTKLIEYMAMGKAVVANDHPEQRLVISESEGGICVPYQEQSLAEAILYLLDNPDVARQMGIRGRRYVDNNRNYEQTADFVEKKLLELSGCRHS